MTAPIGRVAESFDDSIYFVFRVLVGALFMQHGAQKLFGLFGGIDGSGGTAPLMGMYGLAGVIELLGGLLIAVGVLTRLIALITTGQMIIAQLIAHIPEGVVPIQNGGELGLLYIVAFLILIVNGDGRYSIERYALGRELF
ncbi:DoxX family protein [Halocatena marina]|uniref:DoxX family protein n=1 Tax=Halocatena marina TaxID=2934937 RepID=UPI00200F4460|nr:DoxX family protein [Halocatena marina]